MKCYICGREATDRHHIFNGAMRNKSEEYGAVVNLCRECHNAVHNDGNQTLNRNLKAHWQRQLMIDNDWTVEEFIQVFKKSYL